MLDLVVVGAGLSGLMAAYSAAQAGMKVKIINKGLGANHWSAGTVDFLGYISAAEAQAIQHPFDALDQLIENNPEHPYALLEKEQISQYLARFVDLVDSVGLPYAGTGDAGENTLLPSPAGAPRPTYLAPEGQIEGDLSRDDPILVVGFQGMRDFYPLLIAENLSKLGYQARAALLPLRVLTDRRDFNTVQIAEGLDDESHWSQLGKELRNLVQEGERIALPAVLGLHKHAQLIARLQEICEASIFEIPTLPPSVPGIRLLNALQHQLRRMGVRLETAMEVTSGQYTAKQNGAAGHVNFLESKTTARPLKHRAKHYLLATGGILGGGFNSDQDGRIWETILDLPLTIPQERSQWFESGFLSPAGHPVYTGGVLVNEQFQPVSNSGEILYHNLWAAGQLLAGTDPILERSVEGIAIVTGMAAGQKIAES